MASIFFSLPQSSSQLGIAVAAIVGQSGKLAQHTELNLQAPDKPSKDIKLWLLRKVQGYPIDHTYSKYADELESLRNNRGYGVLNDLYRFYSKQYSKKQGRKAACYLLGQLRSGRSFKILESEKAELGFNVSAPIRMEEYGEKIDRHSGKPFNIGQRFCEEHDKFVQGFLKKTQAIGKMQQSAFNQAIALIIKLKNMGMGLDFSHHGNVLINEATGEFQFVDIWPADECTDKKSLEQIIYEFTETLFGKGFLISFMEVEFPHRLIYEDKDVLEFEKSILDKIREAATENGIKQNIPLETIFSYHGNKKFKN